MRQLSFILVLAAGILLAFGCDHSNLAPTPVTKVEVKQTDLHLTVFKDNAAADGVNVNTIQFTGGPSVDSFYSYVTLSISPNGQFANDSTQITLPIILNGPATTFAFSGMPGTSIVTATVGGVSAQVATIFTFAWPEKVVVTADSTFLSGLAVNGTGVTVKLVRDTGRVNSGIVVNFSDSTASGAHPGVFKPAYIADTLGVASTKYVIVDTSYHGLLYINATVKTSAQVLEGATLLNVR